MEAVFGGETNGFDNFIINDGEIPPPIIPLPAAWVMALPWLAGQIGTPDVPKIPLPGGGAGAGPAGAPLQAATH